ncbi:hypothetical protein CYR83_02715 [Ligilactobacillus agilis]|uniref:Uncharacterized protein n=1 Tax=Ligilactobacillus agilis TaxID=1601 RepID=A0A2I2AAP1_9LACO|nr:hypothetical protein [Ligilactobacillus agilis]PLA76417.1 hypothetical protein CYR79_06380 [Ligilactobacillus agilis]PLA83606.1 hypothetical protein CYR83_02715 [Ligilactobacillus agilis]
MNILDVADKLAYYSTELNSITNLMGINLSNSDISKSNELERITFLTEYTKQLASELDNLSTSITDDLKSIKHE